VVVSPRSRERWKVHGHVRRCGDGSAGSAFFVTPSMIVHFSNGQRGFRRVAERRGAGSAARPTGIANPRPAARAKVRGTAERLRSPAKVRTALPRPPQGPGTLVTAPGRTASSRGRAKGKQGMAPTPVEPPSRAPGPHGRECPEEIQIHPPEPGCSSCLHARTVSIRGARSLKPVFGYRVSPLRSGKTIASARNHCNCRMPPRNMI
jgi:hypothetical protein